VRIAFLVLLLVLVLLASVVDVRDVVNYLRESGMIEEKEYKRNINLEW